VVLPEQDSLLGVPFAVWRSSIALVGVGLLVIGLVWDGE